MSSSLIERRLGDVSTRLKRLREELAAVEEQFAHLAEEAEEARVRALVSETPMAAKEHRDASRHADAMGKHRAKVIAQIAELEAEQDRLLDRFQAERRA
jgi:flagellar biosynthesis chaperone FliJ